MYSDLLESPSKDNYMFNDQPSPYDMSEVNELSNQTDLDYIFDSYYSESHYNPGSDTGFDLPEDNINMSFSELFDQELFSTHDNKDCKLTIKFEKEDPCYSANDSQDANINQMSKEISKEIMESLASYPESKHFGPTRGITRTSIKVTQKCDVERLMQNLFHEPKNVDDQQTMTVIKCEPVDINDETIEQNTVESEVEPYYSADDSQNANESYSVIKIEDNIQSSLSKNTAHKNSPSINISMKTTENCDIEHLTSNTDNVVDDQISVKTKKPIIKCEPIEIETIGIEINSHHSIASQNHTANHSLVISKDKIQSLPSLNSTLKHPLKLMNKASVKTTENCVAENLMSNNHSKTKKIVLDQMSVKIKTPIIKCEPEEVKDIIDMKIKPDSINLQNQVHGHRLVKCKDNIQYSLLKGSTPKRSVINKTSLKPTKNCGNKNFISNNLSASKNLGLGQMSIKIKKPIIKRKPEEVNNIINMEINPNYSIEEDSQIHVSSQSLIKMKDKIQSSLSKNSIIQCPVIDKTFLKTSKNCDIKNLMSNNISETKNLDQKLVKIKTPIVKCEPEDINDIIEQDIEMEMKNCFSLDNSQNGTKNCSQLNIKNNFSSLLLKGSFKVTSNRQVMNQTSIKTTENLNTKHNIHNSIFQLDGQVSDQMTVQVKIPVIKCEPVDLNEAVDQNLDEMEIQHEETLLNKEKSKYTDPKVFCCSNFNSTITKSEETFNIKKENIVSSMTSVKNDIESLNYTTKNDILDNEKKKISWEEYKAKVGKMGLLKFSEDNDETATNIAATKNDKLETVIEEFDRNTAEYFIGQKRKIEDKEQISIAKETNSEEEQELQNKRMKIEYIKKLLPSSFASEIAKTSSLMKGNYVDDTENESTSDDSMMSSDKSLGKITDTRENLRHFKKDDKFQKKVHPTRVHSFHRNSTRPDYGNKSSRLSSSSSSSNPDDFYNRNRIDVSQNGQYNQNIRNTVQRSRDQKRVVYVGQIPIKFGKQYLYNRFKTFGTIQSLTLHKKPDFRVYYAFVTYSEKSEAECAINHGNDDETQVQLDIRFGERKQTQTPYYDLDDEWLTDWYGYNQPVPVVRAHSPEKTSFEEELQEFYKLAQIKKSNQIKPSQVS